MSSTKYKSLILYYFSGTGNAKRVAEWIKSVASQNALDAEIVNISTLEKRKVDHVPENTLIGICSPTHGFNFPPIVLNFIFRFPKANKNKIFLINTRAGMKLWKYFVPGLSGVALWLSAIALKIKGYKIMGLRSIDLPSNWISLHPGLKQKVVDSIFEKRKKQTESFASKIIEKKKIYSAFYDLIQDVLIAPIAFLYYIIGRFILAKSFIASHDCTRCDLCVKKCPVDAIKIVDKRCYWTYKCESCMQCMNSCPERAIETTHGFVIGLSFLIYGVLIVYLHSILGIEEFVNSHIKGMPGRIMLMFFNSAVYVFAFFLFYRIMHYLMRYRLFERLFVLSSFTHYKFWRRYKAPKKS